MLWCLQDALRGQSVLFVSNSSAFSPGQWVRLVLSAPATGGIATDLMGGLAQETADYRCVQVSGMLSNFDTVLLCVGLCLRLVLNAGADVSNVPSLIALGCVLNPSYYSPC